MKCDVRDEGIRCFFKLLHRGVAAEANASICVEQAEDLVDKEGMCACNDIQGSSWGRTGEEILNPTLHAFADHPSIGVILGRV